MWVTLALSYPHFALCASNAVNSSGDLTEFNMKCWKLKKLDIDKICNICYNCYINKKGDFYL